MKTIEKAITIVTRIVTAKYNNSFKNENTNMTEITMFYKARLSMKETCLFIDIRFKDYTKVFCSRFKKLYPS